MDGIHATDDAREVALSVSDLRVTYGDFVAVERASLDVRAGEAVAIVGPNGNGKSSIAMGVAGLAERRGTVRLFGQLAPPGHPGWMVRHGLSLVPERRQLFPRLSVQDNILLGCYGWTHRLRTAATSEPVARALDLFPELKTRLTQTAGTLSGGQQQMVAVARGIASSPRVLIVDEPCLGLAEIVRKRVYEVLMTMNRAGLAFILIEENPVRALEVSHRVVRVQNGITSNAQPAGAPQAGAGS